MSDNNEINTFKGSVSKVTSTQISGWAMLQDPSIPAEVDLYFDDQRILRVKACTFRKDLRDQGLHPTGNCGFLIKEFDGNAFNKAKQIHVRFKNTGQELTNSPFYNFSDDALRLDSSNPIFIFTHIPKTAGTSFRRAAELEFGKEQTLRDYGNANDATSKEIHDSIYKNDPIRFIDILNKKKIRFISGHFPARKYYSILKYNVRWIVLLRDPVQRLVSEYMHRKRHQTYSNGLKEFCQDSKFFNLQAQAIAGIGLQNFYFVGLMEEYENSIKLFNKKAGVRFNAIETNIGRKNIRDMHKIDSDVKTVIEKNHAEDIELYRNAQAIFFENWNGNQGELDSIFATKYKRYAQKLAEKI